MLPATVLPTEPQSVPPADVAQLFETHADAVMRLAYRVTGRAADAEDVLQTVFLRVLRRADALNANALQPNPRAYLLRAGVNAALDIVRRRKLQLVSIDEVSDFLPALQDDPERQRQDYETQRQLRQALGKLNEKAAAMFVLRHFEGLGNQEIAAIMGTSPLAVGVTLPRSRRHLRQTLTATSAAYMLDSNHFLRKSCPPNRFLMI